MRSNDASTNPDAEVDPSRRPSSTEPIQSDGILQAPLDLVESRFAECQEAAHIGSWEWDFAENTEWWSDELFRICGYEPRSFRPTFESFSALLHHEDVDFVLAAISKGSADRQPFEFEHRIVRPDGEVRTLHARCRVSVDAAGAVARMVGTAQDITERKTAEEVLRRSEQRLQTIIDAEPACVKLVSPEGLLLHMNRAGLDMLGAEGLPQLVGHAVTDLVHPGDREAFVALHRSASRGQPGRCEFRMVGLDGRERWMDSHAVPFDARSASHPSAVLSVTSDVTERKNLEAQLRQSQRLEAVGRLAGGVAHDFNNLLTAILGFSDVASAQLGEHPAQRDLDEIRNAGERAVLLIQQLLAFSRKQILKPRVLDINASIERLVMLLPRIIGEDITVSVELEQKLMHVRVDATQLDQVLLNLAVNARDAMPNGGSLRIATSNIVLARPPITQPCKFEPGPFVALKVTDTGVGMDAETRASVFEPFFTTKETGTGLGLATAYGIVKQSRGFVTVDSEPGQGTTFTIYLPATLQLADEPLPVPNAAASGGTETILVVEDADGVRQLVCRSLTALGYAVLTASGAEEALQVVSTGAHIDLLLTDVVMPKVSGVELAQQFRRSHPLTPVLYMSGYDDIRRRGLAKDQQLTLLQKPFTAEQLRQFVREALDRREG